MLYQNSIYFPTFITRHIQKQIKDRGSFTGSTVDRYFTKMLGKMSKIIFLNKKSNQASMISLTYQKKKNKNYKLSISYSSKTEKIT